jgi:hypothetical protein
MPGLRLSGQQGVRTYQRGIEVNFLQKTEEFVVKVKLIVRRINRKRSTLKIMSVKGNGEKTLAKTKAHCPIEGQA